MSTAEQVLAVARREIGYVEAANGANKYGAYYGMDRVAWCAQFQWWVFNQAHAAALIPKTAYTPTFYQWFVGQGRAGQQPRPGALVFYDWPDSVNRIQHVGIVEAVHADGTITAIEGNTSDASNSDGGTVARRHRTTRSVKGYGYPAYSNAAPAAPTPAAGPGGELVYGLRNNARVKALQAALNRVFPSYSKLPVTGNYLEQTTAVVKEFQRRSGIKGGDGRNVGPQTRAALARHRITV